MPAPTAERDRLNLVRRGEVFTAVEEIGAELSLLRREMQQSLTAGRLSDESFYILESLRTLLVFGSETAGKYEADGCQGIAGIAGGLKEMYEATFGKVRESRWGIPKIDVLDQIYSELLPLVSRRGASLGLPPGVKVVAYNTQLSGIPEQVLREVEKVESELLIDTAKLEPQEGFRRALDTQELKELLMCRAARLYAVSHDEVLIGFYVALLDPNSVTPHVEKAFQALDDAGNIPRGSRYGWCEIVGVTREGRERMRSLGINAYDLLDSAVVQTAQGEELDYLFAMVREGVQANTAKEKHLRFWQETGIILWENEGTIPYQLLARTVGAGLVTPQVVTSEELRAPSKTEVPYHDRTPFSHVPRYDSPKMRTAEGISTETAMKKVKEWMDKHLPRSVRNEAVPLFCSDGLVIQMRTSCLFYNLRQARPRLDHWAYEPAIGSDCIGALDEVLDHIAREVRERGY